MTKVFFDGGYRGHEGSGYVYYRNGSLKLSKDDFMLVGNINEIKGIGLIDASLDLNNAKTHKDLFLVLHQSKAKNINNANKIWLYDNSSISNFSTNDLRVMMGNNTIDGTASATAVKINRGTLNIAKDGVLKVPNIKVLDFSNIRGDGKIYTANDDTFYRTNGRSEAMYNDKSLLAADIIKYNFTMAKEIKEMKEAYINAGEQQDENVELLNTQMVNSDGLL